jgi:hypothetical protein
LTQIIGAHSLESACDAIKRRAQGMSTSGKLAGSDSL